MNTKTATLPKRKEIEPETAALWVSLGSITPTWYGEENTYYVNEFGHEFFSKNYPTLHMDYSQVRGQWGVYGVLDGHMITHRYIGYTQEEVVQEITWLIKRLAN